MNSTATTSTSVFLFPVGGSQVGIRPLDYLDGEQFDAYLTAVRTVGANYDASSKAQVGRIERVSDFVTALRAGGFGVQLDPTIAESLLSTLNKLRAETDQIDDDLDAMLAALASRSMNLLPFQREGVLWLRSRAAGILGDDPGLGKTIQGLMAIPQRAPTVVVSPATAKGVWAKHVVVWRPDLYPTLLSGRRSFRWPLPGEIVITNYDILPECNAQLKIQIDAPTPRPGTILIADEAHMLKSTVSKAQRSKRFRAMARAVLKANGRVYPTTGTPIMSKPSELWTLLQHIELAEVVFGSWSNFKRLMGWDDVADDWNPEKVDPAVADLLRSVLLRRLTADVHPLPGYTDIAIPCDIDPATIALCDEAMAAARTAGVDLVRAAEVAENATGFEYASRVRSAIAASLIPSMLREVDAIEATGEPQLVFSAHRPPIDVLENRPGWAVITGDTSPDERSRLEGMFQRGLLKGLGITIRAGGVALTLTRAHQALFVDLEWTPALNDQARKRIRRMGQTKPCIYRRLIANHELCEHVDRTLMKKQAIIDATIERATVSIGDTTLAASTRARQLEESLSHVSAITTSTVRTTSGSPR
jgi:SNF2 family DNA or RNA helicase